MQFQPCLTAWALAATVVTASPIAAAAEAAACTLLPAASAAAAMATALPENFKRESKPSAENGHDHTTICGWFPKGYNLAKAEAPPSRGVQLSLHTMKDAADAKAFHGLNVETAADGSKAGGKPTPLPGVADGAVIQHKQVGGVHLANVWLLKGRVAAQLQVWNKDAAPGDAATTLARQIAGRL